MELALCAGLVFYYHTYAVALSLPPQYVDDVRKIKCHSLPMRWDLLILIVVMQDST